MRAMLIASWLAMAPCPGGGGTPSPDAAPPPPDAPTRAYHLASAAVQLDPVAGPVHTADLAGDVDAVNVHQDFFGVPWDAFAAGAAPPPAWAATMSALAAQAHATGKPIFLALGPLDGDRRHLAPRAVASATGGFDVIHAWAPACHDLATAPDGAALREAYARYVDYMVRLFQPRWTNVAIEISLFHLTCPAAWSGIAALERDAYAAAKTAAPATIAFPSIQIDALYGRVGCPSDQTRDQCYDAEYAALADLARDRFAISSYPYNFAGFAQLDDVPADYLTRGAARGGERAVIAETGWLATDEVVAAEAGCVTAIASSPAVQAAYFDRAIAAAVTADMELVTWISNRDFLPAEVVSGCPCTYSQPWCDLLAQVRGAGTPTQQRDAEVGFKVFGAMGLRDHAGAPRQPLFDHWTAARALPVAP
jgi:hypothetical protein